VSRFDLNAGNEMKTWQKMRVIFILKPGCSSYELAKSFRPQFDIFSLENDGRLVDFHIKEAPLKDYLLKPMQHAYLKGKSTETVYKIDGSLAQQEFALGVFHDVEGAFDNTSFELMDDAASDHGVCSNINRWIDFHIQITQWS
jgi:hypothetical protein